MSKTKTTNGEVNSLQMEITDLNDEIARLQDQLSSASHAIAQLEREKLIAATGLDVERQELQSRADVLAMRIRGLGFMPGSLSPRDI